MSDLAIRVEGLGKRYQIGERQKYKALRDTLTDALYAPFRAAASVWNGHRSRVQDPPPANHIWALKDVSFEVKRGEVVGVIGRNGAGKSTLLKILSRITEPTQGRAEIHGRVGSLLEVGTGFHPELTGRENVYLNGAILGMRKAEIERKFDEIAAFAEVEKFLDTPVKHYSSGMHVRLAFSVAAHLEPEILLVDEVLAVGDAAFQKKCLGKMGDVAKEGRTVLFVSHNMGAIRYLCDRATLLAEGTVAADAGPSKVISTYLTAITPGESGKEGQIFWMGEGADAPGTEEICLRGIRLLGPSGIPQSQFEARNPIHVEIIYEVRTHLRGASFFMCLLTQEGEVAFWATDHLYRPDKEDPGMYKSTCTVPGGLLNTCGYIIAIECDIPGVKIAIPYKEHLAFSVSGAGNQTTIYPFRKWPGTVCPKLEWKVERISTTGTSFSR